MPGYTNRMLLDQDYQDYIDPSYFPLALQDSSGLQDLGSLTIMDNSIATSEGRYLPNGAKPFTSEMHAMPRKGINGSTGSVQVMDQESFLHPVIDYEPVTAMKDVYNHSNGADERAHALSYAGYGTDVQDFVNLHNSSTRLTSYQHDDSIRQHSVSTDSYRSALYMGDVNKDSHARALGHDINPRSHSPNKVSYYEKAHRTSFPLDDTQASSWVSAPDDMASFESVNDSWPQSPSASFHERAYPPNSRLSPPSGNGFETNDGEHSFSTPHYSHLSVPLNVNLLLGEEEDAGSSVDAPELIPSSKTSPSSSSDDGQEHGKTTESNALHNDHPLYKNAQPGPDGKFLCPFAEQQDCGHRPTKHRCAYEKYLDSHFKPHRCRVTGCEELKFSSSACLVRHEREAHGSHGHGVRPFLCFFPDCERSKEGMGFPRSWNRNDHMKRVHDYQQQSQETTKATADDNEGRETRKRPKRGSSNSECGRSKRTKSSKDQAKQSNEQLKKSMEDWVLLHSEVHDTWHAIRGPLDFTNVEKFATQAAELLSSAYKIAESASARDELREIQRED